MAPMLQIDSITGRKGKGVFYKDLVVDIIFIVHENFQNAWTEHVTSA